MMTIFVEVNTKAFCQCVEMLKLGVPFVVFHQHQHSAFFHPGNNDLDCIFRDKIWIFCFQRCIRINDNIDTQSVHG